MNPDMFAEAFGGDAPEQGPYGFPPEVEEEVEGLRHLGYMTDEVEFCGHEVTLKTLNADEEIAAAVASKDARGTVKEVEAWMRAVVGLALTSVDGDSDFCPPSGGNLVEFAKQRYRYTGRWFSPTIEYFYSRYATLIKEQVGSVRAFQDFSARNLDSDLPSLGSWIAQGTSPDGMTSVAPD
jgi:hypothetical protein